MVRAWLFDDVAACRAVSIFKDVSCSSPLNLGTLFRCRVVVQVTSDSNASLDSCKNEWAT